MMRSAGKDLKTLAIVLRRTNYGEADRILNLITPNGKIVAIAKGVRRPKSKLAGGVEMFCLSELQIHLGKSELGVVTSARMVKHYGEILQDYERMELMALVLKKIAMVAEHTDSREWFEITRQVLEEINGDTDAAMIEAWFLLNLARVSGEEVNLYRDVMGVRLDAEKYYDWNVQEEAFSENEQGEYGVNEIKILRLMVTANLATVKRVKVKLGLMGKVLNLAKIVAKN